MKVHIILLAGVTIWALAKRTIAAVGAVKTSNYSKLKAELFFIFLIVAVASGLLYLEYNR